METCIRCNDGIAGISIGGAACQRCVFARRKRYFEELDALNMACISYLVETKVIYLQQKNYSKWTVMTWSTNIQHCKIVDKGTAEDVQNLCAPTTSYNKRRQRNNE